MQTDEQIVRLKARSAFSFIEADLIRCEGLLDAAHEIAMARAEAQPDRRHYDGLTELLGLLIETVNAIGKKLENFTGIADGR